MFFDRIARGIKLAAESVHVRGFVSDIGLLLAIVTPGPGVPFARGPFGKVEGEVKTSTTPREGDSVGSLSDGARRAGAIARAVSRVHVEGLESRRLMAISLPAQFEETVFADGIDMPISMEFAPDGNLFVLQQTGQIRRVTSAGVTQGTPFMSISVNADVERGLM